MHSRGLNPKSPFYQSVLCFLLATHSLPLKSYVEKNNDKKAKLITFQTSFNEAITINLEELPSPSGKDFNTTLAQMLINSCYEIAKKNSLLQHLNLKEREFFRHIRNASSHNGRFAFSKKEPTKEAGWKGLNITKELESKSLFDFIAIGDVILFLQDIDTENWANV